MPTFENCVPLSSHQTWISTVACGYMVRDITVSLNYFISVLETPFDVMPSHNLAHIILCSSAIWQCVAYYSIILVWMLNAFFDSFGDHLWVGGVLSHLHCKRKTPTYSRYIRRHANISVNMPAICHY